MLNRLISAICMLLFFSWGIYTRSAALSWISFVLAISLLIAAVAADVSALGDQAAKNGVQ